MKKTLKSIPKKLTSEQLKLYLTMQLEKALKRARRPKRRAKTRAVRPAATVANPSQSLFMQSALQQAQVDQTVEQLNQLRRARNNLLAPPQHSQGPKLLDAPQEPKLLEMPDAERQDSKRPGVVVSPESIKDTMELWYKKAYDSAISAVADREFKVDDLKSALKDALDKKLVSQSIVDEVTSKYGYDPLPVDKLLKSTKAGHNKKDTWLEILLRTPGSTVSTKFADKFRDNFSEHMKASGQYSDDYIQKGTDSALQKALGKRKAQLGYGLHNVSSDDMLSNINLDKLMRKIPEYAGTFARDTFAHLVSKPVGMRVCWILNTDPAGEPGQHWVAVFIDPSVSKTCEYYDPFGEPCPDDIYAALAKMTPKMSPSSMLKFKENLAVNQSNDSNNCGYFCLKFLLHRLAGKPWKFASGYTDLQESDIEQFKRSHPMFKGFVKYV